MSGRVEQAIRAHIAEGDRLYTVAKRAPFRIAQIDADGVVLLLGAKEARTRFSWACLEGVVPFLSERDWTPIGGTGYSTERQPGTLDGYLKGHVNRATASWVAALLATAGVVEIDENRPAKVRLRSEAIA